MESGLNFVSIDFAKIGSMLLNRGQWNGQQIISVDWIDRSTVSTEVLSQEDADSDYLKKGRQGTGTCGTAWRTGKEAMIISPQANTGSSCLSRLKTTP